MATEGTSMSKTGGGGKTKAAPKPAGLLNADALLNEYDKNTYIPKKVRDGLARLGDDGAMKEAEFARFCGVSCLDLSGVRDEHFEGFYVVVRGGKRVWFGSRAFASRMREKIT